MNDARVNTEEYLKMGELLTMLKVSRSTIYRLMAQGMPAFKVGGSYRFPREQVLSWLENANGQTEEETP